MFTRTKHGADRIARRLEAEGIKTGTIHSNRSQNQRLRALKDFKSGAVRVLVATDIAARGIDVQALPHVVNFDVPVQPEDYIHRVGRTARAQATGHAITFAAPEEGRELAAIERAVGKRIPRRTLQGFDYAASGAKLEIPLGERIAQIRARKAEERARARAKAEAKAARTGGAGQVPRSSGKSHGAPTARPQHDAGAAHRPQHDGGAAHRPQHDGGASHRPAHESTGGRSAGHRARPAPPQRDGGRSREGGANSNPWPGRATRKDSRPAPPRRRQR